MAACERCWRAAYIRSRISGGSQVDHYYDLLAEHPDGHDEKGED